MLRWGWLLACLALAVFALLLPREAQAHPLGNFTINHYSSLEFAEKTARITYVLDLAEIPTLQQKARLDADGDGKLSNKESDAYLDAELPSLVEGLRLRVGGEGLPLEVQDRSAEYRPGQGGLPTLRVEAHLMAELPRNWRGEAYYADHTYENRVGWREIVVRSGPGVSVRDSTTPARDVSNELRSYPQDMLSSPPDVREATFTLALGDGPVENGTTGRTAEQVGTSFDGVTQRVSGLVPAGSSICCGSCAVDVGRVLLGRGARPDPGPRQSCRGGVPDRGPWNRQARGYTRAYGDADPHSRSLRPRSRDPLPVTLHPARSPLSLVERSLRTSRRPDRTGATLPPSGNKVPLRENRTHARGAHAFPW